jgi:hypothetical protein
MQTIAFQIKDKTERLHEKVHEKKEIEKMKRLKNGLKLLVFAFILLVFVSLPETLPSKSITYLHSTKDSYVSSGFLYLNYGTDPIMMVESYATSGLRNCRAFCEFNIAGVPSGVTVRLILYIDSYTNTAGRTYTISRIIGSWEESEITWNNQPSVTGSISVDAPTYTGPWSVDVSSLFVTGSTIGFSIKDSYESDSGVHNAVFQTKEHSEPKHEPLLSVIYPLTNDYLAVDLTGASYKGAKTLLAAKQDYKFVYKCSDPNGISDLIYGLNYAEIRLDYGSKNVKLRAEHHFSPTDTWTFIEYSDPSNYVTLNTGACSYSVSGNQITLNFMVTINWNWGDSPETIEVQCYVTDIFETQYSSTNYANVFGVEDDLTASSLVVKDFYGATVVRCDPEEVLTFTGYLKYEGTSVFPPNGDYQVKVRLSGAQKGSTDTSLVDGFFSVGSVAAPASVDSYVYTVEASHMTGTSNFPAIIVDKMKVTNMVASDDRANVNSNVNIDATLVYSYDSSQVTTGTFQIIANGFGYTASHIGSGVWRITRTSSFATSILYDDVAGIDGLYSLGVVGIDQNGKSVAVIWDKLSVSFIVNSTVPDNGHTVTFTVSLTRQFDSSSVSSYKFDINRNGTLWKDDYTSPTFTDMRETASIYTYHFQSVTDNTYGLTTFSAPSDILVIWGGAVNAPAIGEFEAPAIVFNQNYFLLNVTIKDGDGYLHFKNCTVEIDGSVILMWENSTNTFSLYADPNDYCTLYADQSFRTVLNSTSYKLTFKIELGRWYPFEDMAVDIISSNTTVYDDTSLWGSNGETGLFLFEKMYMYPGWITGTQIFGNNSYGYVNVSIFDSYGWEDLSSLLLQINTFGDAQTFTLKWDDSFSEVIDGSNICVLDEAGSDASNSSSQDMYVAFRFKFVGGCTLGSFSANVTAFNDEECNYTVIRTGYFTLAEFEPVNELYIGNFISSSETVSSDTVFTVGCRIVHPLTVDNFVNASIELSHGVILKWNKATGTFSIFQNTNGTCTMVSGNLIFYDDYTYLLYWNIKLSSDYPEGQVDVLEGYTRVYDANGNMANSSTSALFTFQHMIIPPEIPSPINMSLLLLITGFTMLFLPLFILFYKRPDAAMCILLLMASFIGFALLLGVGSGV